MQNDVSCFLFFYHIRNVNPGPVAASDDAETESAARFLQQLHFDDVEHVVVLERRLVAVHHHAHFGRRLAQHGQRPAVGDVAEAFAVHLQNLIARLEPLVPGRSSVRIHFVNQNGSLRCVSQALQSNSFNPKQIKEKEKNLDWTYQKGVGSTDDTQTESQFILVDFDGRLLARLDFADGRIG